MISRKVHYNNFDLFLILKIVSTVPGTSSAMVTAPARNSPQKTNQIAVLENRVIRPADYSSPTGKQMH